MLTATALPQQFALQGFQEILQPLVDAINQLEKKVAQLDDAITAQTAAIAANTTATNNAVAAMGQGGVTQAQLDAIAKNTTDIQANTVKLATATPPPPIP